MSDEGRLIAGRYRLHQQIGSGAMGVVWRAVDERLNRTVAVKQLLLQPGYTPDETEEARQRSMREGRIAARLQHQNAIVIFDVAEDEGQPVLVMEYLPSRSLASVLAEQELLAPLEVARIGAQVAGALSAAHMAGIVHRDLKPGNILLGDNGVAKITDFGISRAIGDVSVTKSGILAGTPAYLSPEVALGRDPAPASDVFSLGSTLYAAIEGEPPFGVDDNAISLLHRVARGEVTPPRQAGPMTTALMQLLQPDPVDRPTMDQAREMLQAVVEGRPVPPPNHSSRYPTPPPAPRAGVRMNTPPPSPSPSPPPPPPPPSPTTQSAPPGAAAKSLHRGSRRALVLWAIALVVAVVIGIVVANAVGRPSEGSGGEAQSGPDSASPVATSRTSTIDHPVTTAASTTPTSTSSSSTTSTTSSTTPTAEGFTEDLAEVVEEYYSLVPTDLDAAWDMLGPALQAQGKEAYESFWHTIADVEITDGPATAGATVTVGLLYTKIDGSTSAEMHTLEMVPAEDGTPLINGDIS